MEWSRRTALQATAGVVVVLLAVLLWQRVGMGADEPRASAQGPGQKVPVAGPAPAGAVWYDAAGLHHGATVRPIAIDTPPVSLALVRGGVVYEEEGSLEIWYQPWSGVPRQIGTGTYLGSQLFIGPGSDAHGTTAAWFDRETLVMYDTARGAVLARQREPDRRPTLNYENAMGSRIDYVDHDRVVWTTQTSVYSFDRRSGATRLLSRQEEGAPYVVDLVPGLRAENANDERYPEVLLSRDDGKLVFHGGVGYDPIRFSPDGRYLVVIEEPAESGVWAPLVVDTRTGRGVVPVRSTTYPWVGWAYGHTLMYLQQDPTERHWGRGHLITYDAGTRAVQHVTSPGDVVLPAN